METLSEKGGGENPAPAQPPSPPPATPEPPAAAQVVLTGSKSEREIQLEKDLETERNARKKVECDHAQLQDELHRLTAPAPGSPAVPPPVRARPSCKRGPLGVRTK